jgi:hypothetical protein
MRVSGSITLGPMDRWLHVLWAMDADRWQGPVTISQPTLLPGSHVASIHPVAQEIRVYARTSGNRILEATAQGTGGWSSAVVL